MSETFLRCLVTVPLLVALYFVWFGPSRKRVDSAEYISLEPGTYRLVSYKINSAADCEPACRNLHSLPVYFSAGGVCVCGEKEP